MVMTKTVETSNLTVEVLKSNICALMIRLGNATDKEEIKEIHKDITYYSQILYKKISTDAYLDFMMLADELRG